MGEREILAASLADRLPDRNRSQRNLARLESKAAVKTHQRPPREFGVRVAKRLPEDRHASSGSFGARGGACIGAALFATRSSTVFSGRLRLLRFKKILGEVVQEFLVPFREFPSCFDRR